MHTSRIVIGALAIAAALSAQPNPVIDYIGNAASGWQVAPGSIVMIQGKFLAPDTASAGRSPWPTSLSSVTVQTCSGSLCVDAGLLYVSPTQINAYFPLGMTSITVKNGTILSKSVQKTFEVAAPGIFEQGYDCAFDPALRDTSPCGISATQRNQVQPLRGAVTDQSGNLISSANPLRVGPIYTMWLTGLGAAVDSRYVSMFLSGIPAYGYTGKTDIYANIGYAGKSPQFQGLDQINFQLPSNFLGAPDQMYPELQPCGTYRMELTANINVGVPDRYGIGYYQHSNKVKLPVLVQPGDVACAK